MHNLLHDARLTVHNKDAKHASRLRLCAKYQVRGRPRGGGRVGPADACRSRGAATHIVRFVEIEDEAPGHDRGESGSEHQRAIEQVPECAEDWHLRRDPSRGGLEQLYEGYVDCGGERIILALYTPHAVAPGGYSEDSR